MSSTLKPYKLGDYDWKNPKIRFSEIKSLLESGNSDLKEESLDEFIKLMESIRQGTIADRKEISQFLLDDLAVLLQIILEKNYRMMSELRRQAILNQFIFKVFIFCLELLPQNYPEAFEILQLLLNSSNNYYSLPFYAQSETVNELYKKYPFIFSICPLTKQVQDDGPYPVNSNKDLEMAKVLTGLDISSDSLAVQITNAVNFPGKNFIKSSLFYQKTSIVYLLNVNYFIQIGGIDLVGERIKKVPSLSALLSLMSLFNNLRKYIDDEYWKKHINPYIVEALELLPKTLNEEEVKQSKKEDLGNLFKVLKEVFTNVSTKNRVSEILTLYELEIILICLKSQFLEKRIFAITLLNEKASESENNQEEYENMQGHINVSTNTEEYKQSILNSLNWLRKENYIEWLKTNQVVNILLGETAHAEILRRSSPLFRFLFRNKQLALEKAIEIYDLAIEKHDTLRKQLLKILEDLMELMEISQLQQFFEKITSVESEEMDMDLFRLIKVIGSRLISLEVEEDKETKSAKKKKRDRDEYGRKRGGPHDDYGRKGHVPYDEFGRLRDSPYGKGRDYPYDDYEKFNEGGTRDDMKDLMGARDSDEEDDNKENKDNKDKKPRISKLEKENADKLALQIAEFLWKFIMEDKENKGSPQLTTQVTSIVKDLIESLDKERVGFVDKTVTAINNNIAVAESFEILQFILKGKYPVQKKDGTLLNSKRELILFLETEYSLTNTLFHSIILLKTELANRISKPVSDEEKAAQSITEETPETSQPSSGPKKKLLALDSAGNRSDEELFRIYLKQVEERLKFIRMLKTNSYEKLDLEHVKLLWKLLVENAIYEPERDLFFSTFNSIVYGNSDEAKILNEETVNYIFFDLLLNIDYSSYNLQIFYCFEEYFKHINQNCHLLKVDYQSLKVRTLDLIGFEFLWELYLNCPDQKVISNMQKSIFKLSSHLNDKSERIKLVDICIQHIEKDYENIKQGGDGVNNREGSVQRILRSFDFISNFLQAHGELYIQKEVQNPADAINVIISNQFPSALAPKKFNLTLSKKMTIREVRNLIASKLNPPVASKELILISRGSILEDDETVLDDLALKIQNEQTIWCSENRLTEEDATYGDEAQPMIGPQLPTAADENSPDILEKIENIQNFFPDLEVDFIKFVLKKKNNDADEAASALFDTDLLFYFKGQFEDEKALGVPSQDTGMQIVPYSPQKAAAAAGGIAPAASKEAEQKMSQVLSNNSNTLELLFGLLNLGIAEVDDKVWGLLMNLPLNTGIYESLKNIFGLEGEEEDPERANDEYEWSEILDSQSIPKFFYSLRIVNSLVSCDILDPNNPEVQIKTTWRQRFLRHGGYGYLLGFFLKYPETDLIKQAINSTCVQNTEAKMLSLILQILKIYVHSSLMATSSAERQAFLQKVLDFPKDDPKAKTKGKEKRKTNNTPTFGPMTESEFIEQQVEKIENVGQGSSSEQQQPSSKKQVIEFEELVEFLKKEKDLAQGTLEKLQLREVVVKILDIVKVSIETISKDKDLTNLIEFVFNFILPCFIGDPNALQTIYNYQNIEGILRSIFVESKQDTVRSKLISFISFLSEHFKEILRLEQKEAFQLDAQHKEETTTEEHNSPHNFFLKTLLPFIYECNNETRIDFEYFLMISKLIKASDQEVFKQITDPSRLYSFLIRSIIDRPILEDRSSEFQDSLLSGFLLIAQTLVSLHQELQHIFTRDEVDPYVREFSLQNLDLVKELYDSLFALPNENEKVGGSVNGPPKCKNRKTRENAFSFLNALCDNNQANVNKLINLISAHHQEFPAFVLESSSAAASMIHSELKSTTGYVGLKNLGCTCYMNSLLQQFFMIRPLRNALLNSEVKIKLKKSLLNNEAKSPEPSQSDDKEEKNPEGEQEVEVFMSQLSNELKAANKHEIQTQLNEHVLFQLQNLLAHLAESACEYIYPRQFFNSLKSMNGEKLVLNVQQDVNEFFNALCDKLDICMKGTPQQTLLPDLIGGLLSHEIISLEKDYPYYTEREEVYLTIPLDIKNKQDLKEALNSFIKEDILEGDNKYFCEKYNRKIKVMKRCCIRTLPNTLIITLKRFDFDFSSMQKVKINDHFEFPFSFDIKPWTMVGLKDQIPPEANYEPPEYPESYYHYNLVGILVHSGTAEGGHYYSFIKDRSNASQGWFEFNDNKVKPFDLKNIKSECFGSAGKKTGSVYDDYDMTSYRSAYILFYERGVPESYGTQQTVEEGVISKTLNQTIQNENIELLKIKYFYNMDYFNFVYDLMQRYEFPDVQELTIEDMRNPYWNAVEEGEKEKTREEGVVETTNGKRSEREPIEILKRMVILAAESYLKNKDSQGFVKWIGLIEKTLKGYVPGAMWLLQFITLNPDIFKFMYVDEVSSTVRDAVKDLISKVFEEIYVIEAPEFQEEQEIKNSLKPKELKIESKSTIARFLLLLKQQFWLEENQDFSRYQESFGLSQVMVRLNDKLAHFFIEAGLLNNYFSTFLSIQRAINATTAANITHIKERYHPTNILKIFQTIEALMRSCITDTMFQYDSLAPTYYFPKTINWRTCPRIPLKMVKEFQEYEVFRKCFQPMQDKCDNLVQIAMHIAWNNQPASQRMITLLASQICSILTNAKEIEENLKVIYNLVKLKDYFQKERIEHLFSEEPIKFITYSRDYDLISSMKKVKDTYEKAQAVIALRWIAMMAEDISPVRDYIVKEAERFDWAVEFLYELSQSKYSIYYSSIDKEMEVKMPGFVQKAHQTFSKLFPEKQKENEKAKEVSNEVVIRDESDPPQFNWVSGGEEIENVTEIL